MSTPTTGIDAHGVTHWPYRYVEGRQDAIPQVNESWSNCLVDGAPANITPTGGAVTCLRCGRNGWSTIWWHTEDVQGVVYP